MSEHKEFVKLIEAPTLSQLEHTVNEWLQYYKLVDIRVSHDPSGYLAIVTYTPQPYKEPITARDEGFSWFENMPSDGYVAKEWDVTDKFKYQLP